MLWLNHILYNIIIYATLHCMNIGVYVCTTSDYIYTQVSRIISIWVGIIDFGKYEQR